MKLKIEQKLLYDGIDVGFYSSDIYLESNGGSFYFGYSELKKYTDLKSILGSELFEIISKDLKFHKPENTYFYKTLEWYSLWFIEKNGIIYILSYKEIQYGRYQVKLEGVIYDCAKEY